MYLVGTRLIQRRKLEKGGQPIQTNNEKLRHCLLEFVIVKGAQPPTTLIFQRKQGLLKGPGPGFRDLGFAAVSVADVFGARHFTTSGFSFFVSQPRRLD